MQVVLNEEQKVVEGLGKGAFLVDAGAGVGKTTAITERTIALVGRGEDLDRILLVTFTVKAAHEMADRIFKRTGRRAKWAMNFHRLCTRLLRKFPVEFGLPDGFSIIDDKDSDDLLKRHLQACMSPDSETKKFLPMLKEQVKRNRECQLWPGDQDELTIFAKKDPFIAEAAERYDSDLRKANKLDFDLILFKVAVALARDPKLRKKVSELWDYVQVDEFQDTDLVQFEILKCITPHGNVLGCGDIDQGIYRFRGAEPKNMHGFIKHFKAKVIPLQINYRSRSEILDLANRVIRNNPDRLQKVLKSSKGPGGKVVVRNCRDSKSEAEMVTAEVKSLLRSGVEPAQIAVLFRIGAASRQIEQMFTLGQVPHRMLNGIRFWARKEVKDVIAWVKVLLGRPDWDAYRRATQAPRLGIGDSGWQKVLEAVTPEEGLRLHHANRAKRLLVALQAARAMGPTAESLEHLLESSGYLKHLAEECLFKTEELTQRMGNVQETLAAIREIGSLDAFLDEIVLGIPERGEESKHGVVLATIHGAKGLEWEHVFILSVVDEVLPHVLSLRNNEQIAEERRLLYVAITRAKKGLCLSCPTLIDQAGAGSKVVLPSRFLAEAGLSPRASRRA